MKRRSFLAVLMATPVFGRAQALPQTPEHIHTPTDGRGPRRALLDGVVVPRVVYADTELGIVKFHDDPPRLNAARTGVVEHVAYGRVEVVPLP